MHTYLVYLFAGRDMRKTQVKAADRYCALKNAESIVPGFKATSAIKIDV